MAKECLEMVSNIILTNQGHFGNCSDGGQKSVPLIYCRNNLNHTRQPRGVFKTIIFVNLKNMELANDSLGNGGCRKIPTVKVGDFEVIKIVFIWGKSVGINNGVYMFEKRKRYRHLGICINL